MKGTARMKLHVKGKARKGVAYTLETVIAITLLLIVTAFLFASQPDNKVDFMKARGYDAVSHMEASGELRGLIDAGDIGGIKQRLDSQLDNFDAEICTTACAGTQRAGAVVIDWHHSGYVGNYAPKQLRVYLFQD